MRGLRWLPSLVLLAPWLLGPVAPTIDARVRDLAAPVAFRLLDWETVHLAQNARPLWDGLFGSPRPQADDADLLRTYFSLPLDQRAALRSHVEPALDRIVADAYRAAGLARARPLAAPADSVFPPVLVSLTAPPHVLVVAPRSELRVQSSTIVGSLDLTGQEQLEASVESNGVSSLVTPIGGLATYPSMVLDEPSGDRVLAAAAHEWLHQYLIFYPLGQGYFDQQQTREINETTADIVGQEIGRSLAADLGLAAPTGASQTPPSAGPGRQDFDFAAFMRATRQDTEALLARGDIDAAEGLMRARRDELQHHGYTIRKLNQAYFALYGSYGDGFAASPASPIVGLLQTVRRQSPTLGDFVLSVRGVRTIDDLRRLTTAR